MPQLGRTLIMLGIAIVGLGIAISLGEKLGLGRLPGDLLWKRKNTTVYFPIVTSLVISVVLTLIMNLIIRKK